MRQKLTIKIMRRSQPGWLMRTLILLPFLLGTLQELLGLSRGIRYLLDGAWVLLLLFWARSGFRTNGKGIGRLALWAAAFLGYTLLVSAARLSVPAYYLWGARNSFRFYAAFFTFAAFLTPEEVEGYLTAFDRLFWINFVVSLFQFFILGKKGDFLGGIFGTQSGVNADTNLFFLIVVTKSLLFYLEKRESPWRCVCKCAAALLVAALAELKFFFAEFLLVLALAVFFTGISRRKFRVILAGFGAAILGAALLNGVFPQFDRWFSVEWFFENAASRKGYTSSGDLNRLNAISVIGERWLTGWDERLLGLGLGNCDTSGYAFLSTPFYKKFSYMHYTWMSHAFLYLETGYLGLIFYFGFFLLTFAEIRAVEKRSEGLTGTCCRMGKILAICCLILTVYNASLRSEAAYMAYFVLAIPFALQGPSTKSHKR